MLNPGIRGEASLVVDGHTSAKTVGSGTLDVLATPIMIALMEQAAWTSVADEIPAGSGTVGTLMNVKHLNPTPLGVKVTCESELLAVDGRKLTFRVTAFDEAGLIGEGSHERFIIEEQKFQEKAQSRGVNAE